MATNNNYYVDMKERFEQFKQEIPKDLMPYICDIANIQLAYRKMRQSKGQWSKGPDDTNIETLENYSPLELQEIVKDRITNKIISPVRRTTIPKDNGKERPIGIGSIWDRLVHMCIKLVIETIAEQKFVSSSFGFREQVTAHHALAKVKNFSNIGWNYVVNIDLENFFGTLDPKVMYRELYSIGIRDQKILNYVFRLIKSGYIEKEIYYDEDLGVPQGSIIGPVLSNIYLHSTDVWIRDQYEEWHDKSVKKFHSSHKSQNFARTNLKRGVHVRFADDMLIMCKTEDEAIRWFHAVSNRLTKRLKLKVNTDKSSVINIEKEPMTYLGYTFFYHQQ